MPRMRPTESSWDSDEDLLKDDDSISLNVYPTGKELEDLDEDALLAESDEETRRPEASKINESRNLSHPEFNELEEEEELIALEVEDPDYLEESVEIDNSGADTVHEALTEQESTTTSQYVVMQNTTDDNAHLEISVTATSGNEKAAGSSDEDSDEDNEDDDGSRQRVRFRSERHDVQQISASSKSKNKIPDTLEISKEQQEKVEKYMQPKQWHKNRRNQGAAKHPPKNSTALPQVPLLQQPLRLNAIGLFPRSAAAAAAAGGMFRNRFPSGSQVASMTAISRQGQMFGAGDGFIGASSLDTQRHKILINPHFRGGDQPEPRGSWASSQNSSHPVVFQQQQMLRMSETPSQPPRPSPAQFRSLMSVDLTQRPPLPLFPIQRAPVNHQRPFVPQNFASQSHSVSRLPFQQTGIRQNFIPQRGPETVMFGSSFQQQQPLVQSPPPPQHLQQPQQQFIPGQQNQNLSQSQSLIFHPQSTQPINFPAQVQSQVINTIQQPNIQPSNFASQQQQQQQAVFLNQSFSNTQGFRITQPQPNRIVQPLSGPFMQQTTPPRIQLSTSISNQLPVTPGSGDVPSLFQGFPGGVHVQRITQMEEIGQPIETVVHRKVQSRGLAQNLPSVQLSRFSGLSKLSPGTRFVTNRMSAFGGKRQQSMERLLRIPKPIRIATIPPATIRTESTEEQNSASLEQKQKLEERARRFAQPPPALVAKPAPKRPYDGPSDPAAPTAKQAKLLASRKALAKATFVKKRQEMLAVQKKRILEQRNNTPLDQTPVSGGPMKITTNVTPVSTATVVNQDYDAELQRGLEQQKLLREKFLKVKEQRRQQQAALRRKEVEQRLRSEGLTEDQIKAKLDSDSDREFKPTSNANSFQATSAAAAPAASVSTQNTQVTKPNVVATPTKKPTKTIVLTKSQYEAMMRNMKDSNLGQMGSRVPPGVTGCTQTRTSIAPSRFSDSSQKAAAVTLTSFAPRNTGPRFQTRGKFTGMVRSQGAVAVPLRAAKSVRTPTARVGGAARERAPISNVRQSGPVVPPTIRQSSSEIAPTNQNRRVVFGAGDRSLLSSSLVSIEGLALSTTVPTLVQLAQKVGPVKHVQLMSSERKALLKFHDSEHAMLFARGYNRHMLDLSMISVTVVPP